MPSAVSAAPFDPTVLADELGEDVDDSLLMASVSVIHACEEWLSSPDWAKSLRVAYERECYGQGTSDRNIAMHVWLDTVKAVHHDMAISSIPSEGSPVPGFAGVHPANLQQLQAMLPEPDDDFIRTCCEMLRTQTAGEDFQFPSWLELQKEGISDYDNFVEMTEAVFVQMAHCAELLAAQLFGALGKNKGQDIDAAEDAGGRGAGSMNIMADPMIRSSLLKAHGRDPSVCGVQTRNS
ncbi:unnamed protein product [Amoebophrya sp. A25]|nr:unnamed protein product [Amoebophrya sp. A25]|eukprot:GSA25T00000865001.1